ncbi:long-chain fatty acid transport protein 2-like [Synchiropus splendidus]|uniref:long-chain fatty acid transport protein 2-like n=1 Tax=Synchiropus splendidus TaxID=270530 RepID=UPI00237EA489|nr:long-chain fatty acid transport protein 2-like [Synchiropus splendidus]
MLWWLLPAAAVWIFFHYRYFFQDVLSVLTKLRIYRRLLKYGETNYTVLERFVDAVKAHPQKPMLLFGGETFTYREAEQLSNRVARVLLQTGHVQQGDTVAVMVGNQPMFVWLWLGLVKLGCSAALLNIHVRSKSLLHCFNCSGAKTLLVAAELQEAVVEVLPTLLQQGVMVYILADTTSVEGLHSFTDKMNQVSSASLPKDMRSSLTLASPAVFVYTSGTTGLPKAALVTHSRLWAMALLPCASGMTSQDVIYTCLPLYHSSAFLGMAATIERGATMALRTKFSASQFWDDCRKYDVTVIQYIGEIMRYLCNTPQKANDRNHKVRLAVGNGIRADVWRNFIQRFGNIRITEFYGATEANVSFLNLYGKIGAVGRDGYLNKKLFPYAVIQYDVDKEQPVRDLNGFCMEISKGESGLLISKISQRAPFLGYAGDLKQTEKKRLHNVFVEGDVYFNSGDLVTIDKDDFIYFKDRVGDTFRWKGENVATTEVADVLSKAECIAEASVYGVEVPGQEGRAGMAAVSLRAGRAFDSSAVFQHVSSLLPSYARPHFIRIQTSLEVTSTFKHTKVKLTEEGFNPNHVKDPLYFMDEREKIYVPLTLDAYTAVLSGKIRF